jgi:integrase
VFTNASIEAIEPPTSGRIEYRDARDSALIVRVASTGAKTFSVLRRVNGRLVRATLGPFKRAGDEQVRMSVDAARKALRTIEARFAAGVDVNREKKIARAQSVTLKDVLDDYLSTRKKLKPRTIQDYRDVLNEACSDWLELPIKSITEDMVIRRHAKRGKDSPARANNFVRVLRALWNFADDGGKLGPNPVAMISRKRAWYDVRRRTSRIKDSELPAWWATVTNLTGQRRDSGARLACDFLLFVLLTGLRLSEATGLKWSTVDVGERTITIPDPKNRDPHVLPFSSLMTDIIERRKEGPRSPYVFPAVDEPKHPYSSATLRTWIEIIATDSGVRATPHDLRRTFASVAESLDISSHTVKRLLNHRTGRHDVTDGYIIPSVERLRSAMQRVTDRIVELATAPAPDNVRVLRPRAVA